MVDIVGGIVAAGEAIKLARELNSIDRDMDRAELKIRLVEVIDKLLDAKEALQDAKRREAELVLEIANLTASMERERSFEHDGKGRMFERLSDVEVAKIPFCSTCYINLGKTFPMKRYEQNEYLPPHFFCFNCKDAFYD